MWNILYGTFLILKKKYYDTQFIHIMDQIIKTIFQR